MGVVVVATFTIYLLPDFVFCPLSVRLKEASSVILCDAKSILLNLGWTGPVSSYVSSHEAHSVAFNMTQPQDLITPQGSYEDKMGT